MCRFCREINTFPFICFLKGRYFFNFLEKKDRANPPVTDIEVLITAVAWFWKLKNQFINMDNWEKENTSESST